MDELFVLFEVPERGETWKPEFERRLLSELRRIADEEIIRAASSGQPTTDQNAVDQRTMQIGDFVASRLPPRSGAPAQQTDQGGSRIMSSPEFALSEPAASQLEPGATPENPAVEPEKEETATWSPETKEWHATLAGPVVEGPIGDVQVDASSAAEFEPAADPEDEVSETESESAGEASKRKADPEQLLAQRRELKRKLKDGKGLTKQEAAIYYNKTTRTIFDWCKTDGPLKVVKPRGRITAKSILDFPPEDDIDGPE